MPIWIKLAHTAVVAVVVPVNWRQYGPRNFLWFSDVALLTVLAALWTDSAVLASAAAIGVGALELLWDLDFAACLIFRRAPIGLAAYMLDRRIPLWVRGVSLFHLWMQAALWLALRSFGYDGRGLLAQTALAWIILPLSAKYATPDEDINWALGGRARLLLKMAALPLLVYWPSHFVLKALFG